MRPATAEVMDMGTRLGTAGDTDESRWPETPSPTPERLVPWGKDHTHILLASVPELREDAATWQVFLFRYP